ncbi:beta-lactamase family protein [bacterium]|nr:beta-lactamase family protein [bacterium]
MRWFRKLLPWLVIAAALAVIVYLPDLGPEQYTDLATMFRNERTRQANAGYSVAVCRNGAILYQESFGRDGKGQPLAKDTPMYFGPSSEILSGALLYSLSLNGSISLDDDIRKYLPELPATGLRSMKPLGKAEEALNHDQSAAPTPVDKDAAPAETVTVRALAAHSIRLSDKAFKSFGSSTYGLEAGEFNPEQYFRSRLGGTMLLRSRLAYRILGTVMENAEKTKFDELLLSKLLIPLGMHGTNARPDSLQGVAIGSGLFFGLSFPYTSRVPFIAAPADGIVTTSEDIATFLRYITAPPAVGIESLPPSAVAKLYQPLLPGGDTGFGWRIATRKDDRVIFQGGSIEGFSSRVVIWPERNVGIVILSAQGGVIQSNIVLPWLTSAAERIIFQGSSPRLFPLSRLLVITGITLFVYIVSLLLQTATANSWAKALLDRNELSKNAFHERIIRARTIAGIALRLGAFAAAPLLMGRLIGRPVVYHDFMTMDPGLGAFFIIAMIVGSFRNITRLAWLAHLERG